MTTNTLTNLIPDLYAALDVVSRELVGMIPAVTVDASVNTAAVNESVRVAIAPANTAGTNITPAMSVPAEADQTIDSAAITITKLRAFPFSWNGEEQRGLNNGPGYQNIRVNQIAQAMRSAVNEVEADLCALHATMSRAAGTAGTTPFATNTSGLTAARKILVDNGAPLSDASLILDTTAGASLRTLLNINSTRDESKLPITAAGVITRISDLNVRESGQVVTSTAGTAASATTDNAGYAIGATTITLASAGTGTLVAGDVVTFAGDTNQYVIVSGDTDVSNGGTITLAAPGLRKAMSAATKAITVVAAAARSMAFSRNAIVLATRMPTRPKEGDMALDVMTITDPRSGLSFEVSIYPGYRKIRYEIALAWGVKNIKPEHTALLLG